MSQIFYNNYNIASTVLYFVAMEDTPHVYRLHRLATKDILYLSLKVPDGLNCRSISAYSRGLHSMTCWRTWMASCRWLAEQRSHPFSRASWITSKTVQTCFVRLSFTREIVLKASGILGQISKCCYPSSAEWRELTGTDGSSRLE